MKKNLSNILFAACCVLVVGWFAVQKVQAHRRDKAWEQDLHERLLSDFRRDRAEVTEYIRQYIPDVSEAQIDGWTASDKLENLELDGAVRYFRNAAPNLFRIDEECFAIKEAAEEKAAESSLSGTSINAHVADDAANNPLIVEEVKANLLSGKASPYLARPQRYHVVYTISVDADAVPAGETVRCWMPYPRTDVERQQDVKFIRASEEAYVMAPEGHPHSSLYMEKKAVAGQPTVFTEEFEYTAWGEWHPIDPASVKPYKVQSPGYRYWTQEREKHVRFSPRLYRLADSLTAGIDNPYLQAKAMFTWINDNIPWASAREYSTLENIPEYVLDKGHGDCGMVTLLLMTLCRIKGIPARWQSGFMMHPAGWNLHDWGELYFEGYGWVPVDQSFGIPPYAVRRAPLTGNWSQRSAHKVDMPEMEYFYLGGIDCFRMYVNSDFGQPLYPAKKYPRSETVDFQRGEVEWRGGNLYFPKWSYHMKIQYLD